MSTFRIHQHPILPVGADDSVTFYWQGQPLQAQRGETIAAALFAAGIHVFGHHHKDGAPQGIFCANGQCAQCLVLAGGKPVKACMEPVADGLKVEPVDGLPGLPLLSRTEMAQTARSLSTIRELSVPVLIIGGGPAGLSAAAQLGRMGIETLLVDDKHRLGGKLVLQTHRFFGSVDAVYAGTRGIDIATKLENEVRNLPSVKIWLKSSALAVYSDQKVGILKDGNTYVLVKPEVLLVAAGAREKSLVFKGNTLPGVYGAGAFQTLVNRDLVRSSKRLFIVGGGNVGLIAGYHALQAGIEVVGLVEALKEVGGYKVHRDKLARMGVPIYTSHTVVSANGTDHVESITIAAVDEHFGAVPGTEWSFPCDTVLIAVGLDPVNEFHAKAQEYGMRVLAAGDAEEIAEASAAIFSGKIKGQEAARVLGREADSVPDEWYRMGEILKSKPGKAIAEQLPARESGVFPVLHCNQEIPCNPCTSACPQGLIQIASSDIRQLPVFSEANAPKPCGACEKCVSTCPGLAITLVDYRKDPEFPTVTMPYEFLKDSLQVGDRVTVLDTIGIVLDEVEVVGVRALKANDRTVLIRVKAPKEIARRIAGLRVQDPHVTSPLHEPVKRLADDAIVCRCGRVTAGEIRRWVKEGVRDINELKVVTRVTMGACGGKNCGPLIQRIFREEGVRPEEVVKNVSRPLFMEVPLGVFAGVGAGKGEEGDD